MVENHAIMYISSLGSCLAIGMASRRLGALGIPRNERLVDRLGNIGRYAANFRDLLLARRAQTLHRTKMAHKARFLVGPTPGTSSSTETVMALSRNSRWNVIAKRCDSSRTCLIR